MPRSSKRTPDAGHAVNARVVEQAELVAAEAVEARAAEIRGVQMNLLKRAQKNVLTEVRGVFGVGRASRSRALPPAPTAPTSARPYQVPLTTAE